MEDRGQAVVTQVVDEPAGSDRWWRPGLLLDGGLISLWLVGTYAFWVVVTVVIPIGGLGYDSHAYWLAARSDHPYLAAPGDQNAYLYSPFFLQVIGPLARLPAREFALVWSLVEAACLVWLTQSVRWRWRAPFLMFCALEVVLGNILGLLGVMMVLGLRRPGVWAFAFLSKITPVGVGVMWFAARGEWRSLLKLCAWTAGLTVVSYAVNPQLWMEWLHFLTSTSDGESLLMRAARMGAGALVVALGARRGAVWVMPVGMLIVMPHFGITIKDLSLLAAIPALLAATRSDPIAVRPAREAELAQPRD